MASFGSGRGNVLYLIVCAAPPAQRSGASVNLIQAAGWDVCVITTPAADAWLDASDLQRMTGHPVRSAFRAPDEPEFAPRGDAMLVAPATFNTINKAASGINDSLALGLINEALGSRSVPLALVPWINASLTGHPAYGPNLAMLRAVGAHAVQPHTHDLSGFDDAMSQAIGWLAAAFGEAVSGAT